jgi:hypothetical protein
MELRTIDAQVLSDIPMKVDEGKKPVLVIMKGILPGAKKKVVVIPVVGCNDFVAVLDGGRSKPPDRARDEGVVTVRSIGASWETESAKTPLYYGTGSPSYSLDQMSRGAITVRTVFLLPIAIESFSVFVGYSGQQIVGPVTITTRKQESKTGTII